MHILPNTYCERHITEYILKIEWLLLIDPLRETLYNPKTKKIKKLTLFYLFFFQLLNLRFAKNPGVMVKTDQVLDLKVKNRYK